MKLTFLGAAKQVTGSMYLLTTDSGYKILVDCGMDYETKKNPVQNNFTFHFNPSEIDLVILTHAHIDHSGMLPLLVMNGYNGKILCTEPTSVLTEHLLLDSANIQMHEYKEAISRVKKTKLHLVQKPLYLDKHVLDCMERFVTIDYYKPFSVNDEITITLIKAGHLLGAASVKIEILENKKTYRFGFTGDLGRNNSKLVDDADVFSEIDYLITEGTYGGRNHLVERNAKDELYEYINETCIKQRGRLIIPAFSVGRTQSIVFTINQLKKQNFIPSSLKVFVDSPLAIKSTDVYSKHSHLLNNEAKEFIADYGNLFYFDGVEYLEDKDEHEKIMYYYDACIIVSSAGMVEGGRIQEHILNNIDNPFATILIAGFCAEGTLGHRLLLGQNTIRIKNKDKRVYAKISKTDVFSSHPDNKGLLDYINKTRKSNHLKNIFLIHGDEVQLNLLKQSLEEIDILNVTIPEFLQEIKL